MTGFAIPFKARNNIPLPFSHWLFSIHPIANLRKLTSPDKSKESGHTATAHKSEE